MDDGILLYFLRFVRGWIIALVMVLLVAGLVWGLIIGDVGKGYQQVYINPMRAFFVWMIQEKSERKSFKVEILNNVIEKAFNRVE